LSATDDLVLKFGKDRWLAHKILFKHRHSDETPPFHDELIEAWHSSAPRLVTMAFREGGKSTIAEEALIIGAEYKLFHNCVIVGNTEKRACERLTAIKYELETNEFLAGLFGGPHDEHTSKVWNEAEVVLANNVRLTALGRGQSLRGTKYLQWRPDFCFCDDVEEVEKGQVYTDEEAEETKRWFFKVLIPALDKDARIRVNATPLSGSALPIVLAKDKDWETRTYPIEYIDVAGERQATWPSRYPLTWIDSKKTSMERMGLLADYMQEYMCVAEDPKTKIFTPSIIKVEPKIRTWQPTFAMYDPARTTKATSATTGWAVWSWIGNRMVVWDGGGELWKPDQLIDHIFQTNENYSPVEIGVEEDGLNDFILQPLRHEQTRRSTIIPLRALRAPKGKISFIEGLQPFFLAGEITFAKELPTMRQQLLSFPTGRIDAPNALAYALRMRPGVVVYEDFGSAHVVDDLRARTRIPLWLCLNAGEGLTTGVVVQVVDGGLHVLGDYVREGDPGAALRTLVISAGVDFGESRLVAGPAHFGSFNRLGLRGAVAKLPAELRHGGEPIEGRAQLRELLRQQQRGEPSVQVSSKACWTLNALAAGYARAVDQRGVIQEEPRAGVYATLMAGLESFTALMKVGNLQEDRPNIRVTEGGQRYVSALPSRAVSNPTKEDFLHRGVVNSADDFPR
jgi:hypothetical protein